MRPPLDLITFSNPSSYGSSESSFDRGLRADDPCFSLFNLSPVVPPTPRSALMPPLHSAARPAPNLDVARLAFDSLPVVQGRMWHAHLDFDEVGWMLHHLGSPASQKFPPSLLGNAASTSFASEHYYLAKGLHGRASGAQLWHWNRTIQIGRADDAYAVSYKFFSALHQAMQGWPSQAAKGFLRLQAHHPAELLYVQMSACSLLKARNPHKAKDILTTHLRAHTKLWRPFLAIYQDLLARCCFACADYGRAASLMSSASVAGARCSEFQVFSSPASRLALRAASLMLANQLNKARDELAREHNHGRLGDLGYLLLAECHWSLGQPSLALARMEEAERRAAPTAPHRACVMRVFGSTCCLHSPERTP